MKKFIILIFLISINIAKAENEILKKKAKELADKFIITDGHIDYPHQLIKAKEWLNPTKKLLTDFDYVKAKEGGLDAPFMSIYIPATYQKTNYAKEYADTLIDLVIKTTNIYPKHFALANSPEDVEKNTKEGKISLPMGMENGAPIGKDIKLVEYFYKRGIRYITLTHSLDNEISDSSYDTLNTWKGLSPFGEKVVAEMNRVGIMIDVSHLSDNAIRKILEITKKPVIASHSSCRHFTPNWQRNLSDDLIKDIAQNDGVVQVNFGSRFLKGELKAKIEAQRKKWDSVKIKYEKLPYLEQYQAEKNFNKSNQEIYATVNDVANHIDHIKNLVGINHIGLGSDYDGVGDSLPIGLKDVSQYPNLIYELLMRGYSEEEIEKICYKNIWRVWNKNINQ